MGFELGKTVRAQVGSASMAAMELAQPVAAQERTIETITAEIEQLKARGGEVIIEIGKRLIEAKERLPHGEWAAWLADRVEFSERTAQDFMRLAREYSNPQTLADLGKSKALKLLLLPAAERDEFLEAHDVPNMSTRELEQAIRERDEAKAAAEAEWSAKVDDLVSELAEARKDAELRRTNAQDEHRCITGLNPHGNCGAASYCSQPYACCIACSSPCNSYCGFLPETQSEALPNVAPVVSPCWYVGIPPKDGLYYAEFECAGTHLRTPARWDSVMRYWTFNHGAKIDAECQRWWPLPEDEE